MKIVLSIIVPIYNVEKYLRQCLESLIRQEIDYGYEVILVDDGSTDSSCDICEEYSKKYTFVKSYHKKNGGLVSARKYGLKFAKGKYIACVDGDDWVESNFVCSILDEINKNNPDIICFNNYDVKYNLKKLNKHFIDKKFNKSEIVEQIFPLLIQNSNFEYFSPAIWNKVYKKELYEPIQKSVNNLAKIGEDLACVIPCIYKATSLSTLAVSLYNYRMNNDSMTKGKKVFSYDGPKYILENIEKHMNIKKYDFIDQINYFKVHQFFMISITQFYRHNNNYSDTYKNILDYLNSNFYKDALYKPIKTNRFLVKLVYFVLKHRLLFIIYLYSLFK